MFRILREFLGFWEVSKCPSGRIRYLSRVGHNDSVGEYDPTLRLWRRPLLPCPEEGGAAWNRCLLHLWLATPACVAWDAVLRFLVIVEEKPKERPRKRSRFRRCLLMVVIGFFVTLIGTGGFLALRPEGQFTPVDSTVAEGAGVTRLLTWNILRSEHEAPLNRPWSERKSAYTAAFFNKEVNYDIVCFQEALPDQIEYFETLLPDHDWYGVGREDGETLGEHCPIFYDRKRFVLRRQGTFWLSPTPDSPSCGWG